METQTKVDQNNVYKKVTVITEEYLGPSAKRFVDRQIVSHLNKNPEEITTQDIPKFASWAQITFAIISSDSKSVEEYAQKLLNLAK